MRGAVSVAAFFSISIPALSDAQAPPICNQSPPNWFIPCQQRAAFQVTSYVGNPKEFGVTQTHGTWLDPDPGAGAFRLQYATQPQSCGAPPGLSTSVANTNDAASSDARGGFVAYFIRQGARHVEAYAHATQTLAAATPIAALKRAVSANRSGKGFVYAEGGYVYACRKDSCLTTIPVQLGNGVGVPTNPRMYGNYVVWQNNTSGTVHFANLQLGTSVVVDSGRDPDVNANWMIYSKSEPAPSPQCSYSSHYQVWYYGPLTGSPSTGRIQSQTSWGPHHYERPRLTATEVVMFVNFIGFVKTVVGIYPINRFGSSSEPVREMMDDGYDNRSYFGPQTDFDASEDSGFVHVWYPIKFADDDAQNVGYVCCRGP